MSREDYIKMTDDELIDLAEEGDSEAKFYFDARKSSPYWYGVRSDCGKYTADIDYYGTVEVGNR